MEKYRTIVEDIIQSHLTVLEAAKKHNCSESSIRKYIRELKNSKKINDKELYIEYLDSARETQKQGRKKGGELGKRTTKIPKETLEEIYVHITERDYTLRQLEEKFNIPSSTIYDLLTKNLSKIQLQEIEKVFDRHRRNAANDYENDTDNSSEFHRVGTEMSKITIRIKK